MSELTLHVAGMACRRCVREVTARLRDVPGVETVTADGGSSQVRLSGSMTILDVTRALEGTTYRAVLVHEIGQRSGPRTGVVENRRGTAAGQDAP